jgi:5-formyltetrahydrofolate cyclo-ligase
MSATTETRTVLRRHMRSARRALCKADREAAAEGVADRLSMLDLPRPHSRVAAYLPMDGELDPGPVIRLARTRCCEVYVPVITSFSLRHMRFVRLEDGRKLRANRWGIHEPEGTGVGGRWLDLVLVPCVAFDGNGGRIGLGAGFYDRHFSFLACRHRWRHPRLVGLAYALQQVAELPQQPWDVRLWGVVTERAAHGPVAALQQGRAETGKS